jgi:hypothetical protein
MGINEKPSDELMKDYKNPVDLLGENCLLKQLKKALKGEMTNHFWYHKGLWPEGTPAIPKLLENYIILCSYKRFDYFDSSPFLPSNSAYGVDSNMFSNIHKTGNFYKLDLLICKIFCFSFSITGNGLICMVHIIPKRIL